MRVVSQVLWLTLGAAATAMWIVGLYAWAYLMEGTR